MVIIMTDLQTKVLWFVFLLSLGFLVVPLAISVFCKIAKKEARNNRRALFGRCARSFYAIYSSTDSAEALSAFLFFLLFWEDDPYFLYEVPP